MLILAAACAVPLATPAGAFAHARLIRVEPADGAVVVSAPVAVHLFFNETIRPLQGMRAVRNGGGSVLDAPARVISGGELVIPLRRPLEPGAYTVLWRALSNDGHPVAGITTFAVGAGQPRPQPTLVAPSEHRAVPGFERWLFLSGVLLAVGFAAFKFTMPRAAAPSLRLLATRLRPDRRRRRCPRGARIALDALWAGGGGRGRHCDSGHHRLSLGRGGSAAGNGRLELRTGTRRGAECGRSRPRPR